MSWRSASTAHSSRGCVCLHPRPKEKQSAAASARSLRARTRPPQRFTATTQHNCPPVPATRPSRCGATTTSGASRVRAHRERAGTQLPLAREGRGGPEGRDGGHPLGARAPAAHGGVAIRLDGRGVGGGGVRLLRRRAVPARAAGRVRLLARAVQPRAAQQGGRRAAGGRRGAPLPAVYRAIGLRGGVRWRGAHEEAQACRRVRRGDGGHAGGGGGAAAGVPPAEAAAGAAVRGRDAQR
mmetsp:Transcript_27577/g.63287  ORF Transcript_27577/g.63287 Transcript_27577/m.63287 type:complete len:239 (-) Transcript_27577:277-993(-)